MEQLCLSSVIRVMTFAGRIRSRVWTKVGPTTASQYAEVSTRFSAWISLLSRQLSEAKLWLYYATIFKNEANEDNEGSMIANGSDDRSDGLEKKALTIIEHSLSSLASYLPSCHILPH